MNNIIRKDSEQILRELNDLNEAFAGKVVLISGAAGFLGVQFVNYFLALNDNHALTMPVTLVAVDNFLRGRPPWVSALQERRDICFLTADITKTLEIGKEVHYIIHAASVASPTFYRKYPIETMDANVTGLRNLLEFGAGCPLESFLFFSSSEIYGDPDPMNIPTLETYNGNVSCTGPRACYDESKRFGETLCVNFVQERGMPIKIARPFNNYGPGLRISDRRVLPDFFRDVLAGRSITLLSNGRATRTFCYITDAINGYIRILLSGHNGEAFNIGTERPEISMLELAQTVIRVSGKALNVEFKRSEDKEYLTDNPQRRCPSIQKAQAMLGYKPVVSLEEGLERCYLYYLEHPTD